MFVHNNRICRDNGNPNIKRLCPRPQSVAVTGNGSVIKNIPGYRINFETSATELVAPAGWVYNSHASQPIKALCKYIQLRKASIRQEYTLAGRHVFEIDVPVELVEAIPAFPFSANVRGKLAVGQEIEEVS